MPSAIMRKKPNLLIAVCRQHRVQHHGKVLHSQLVTQIYPVYQSINQSINQSTNQSI